MDRIKEKKQAADQQAKVKLAEIEGRKKKRAPGLGGPQQSLSSYLSEESSSSQSMIDGSVENVNIKINEDLNDGEDGQGDQEGSR